MGRKPAHTPLRVYLNNHRVGTLNRESGGAFSFIYHEEWLASPQALPVSLSLPLREAAYRGKSVVAVFENLLPDSDTLRRRVAEKVGAFGTDAYSMLSAIGHDCAGALQFMAGEDAPPDTTDEIKGEIIDDEMIERLLRGLKQAPLGLSSDDDFRISVAGEQEKTALLLHEGRWIKPHGTTPTTHILKTQIGTLPNGIDLSNSVENEFYCLKLTEAFGLPVNSTAMHTFGNTRALVIQRFDRGWSRDGRLFRLPQEDCCQALSVPPTLKYQNDGGPGMVDILGLLEGSDTPIDDQDMFLKAQMIFWLMGATDGHAKNFSVFIRPGGTYRLTPFYDILSAQPSLVARQIERKQMKLAMSVGGSRHYRFHEILGRHFVQTGVQAGIAEKRVRNLLQEIADTAPRALDAVEKQLPSDFPVLIHEIVCDAAIDRAQKLGLKGLHQTKIPSP